MKRNILHGLSLFLILGLSLPLSAAVISKVTGKSVTVKLEGVKAKKGQLYYVYNKSGKKTGIIKILRVGKTIAKAKLLPKSAALVGDKVKLRTKNKRNARKKRKSRLGKVSGSTNKSNLLLGAMVGITSNNLSVELDNGDKVALSGSGFGAKFLLDYALFSHLWFRGTLGLESFNASGEENLDCGDAPTTVEDCEASINYLSAAFWGRYVISLGTFRPWIGGGADLLIPSSSDASVLDSDSITSTSVFGFGGGFDWFATPTLMIPIQLEYGLYPGTDKVSANYIAVRTGIAFAF